MPAEDGPDVVVTGYAAFSVFGPGVDALMDGVLAGRAAFTSVRRFDVSTMHVRVAATWDDGGVDAASDAEDIFRACAAEALDSAGVSEPERYALIAATKLSSAAAAGPTAGMAERVSAKFGLGRPRRVFVNACVAGASAIIYAAQLIRAGLCDGAVVGSSYLVDRQVFAEFDAVRGLADDGRLRPFDRSRTGVLLGDACGVLVLESISAARARAAPVIGRIVGWALTNDAFHMVQPRPDGGGVAAAITRALTSAGLDPASLGGLGYINAHGTGTVLNDRAEALAIRSALGAAADGVAVSSTKGATGHGLEGCGALEAVITLESLRRGLLPPNASLSDPDPTCPVNLIAGAPRPASAQYALSLNSSVGGLNSALLLESA